MKKKRPTVTIIILTYNSYSLVRNCLQLVNSLTSVSFNKKVIVVDNGLKDNVSRKLSREFPSVVFVSNNINYGFAKGINFGIKLALNLNSDYIFLLNDDTLFKKNFLEILVKETLSNKYPISGPQVITPDNIIWSRGGSIDPLRMSGSLIDYGKKANNGKKTSQVVDFISGTAMLVSSNVFKRIGLLNENYFLYYDDVDFCFRAKQYGFTSHIVYSSIITHLESKTVGKHSPSHYYYAAKSRLIFLFTQGSILIRLRELLRLPLSIAVLLTEKNARRRTYELMAYRDFFLLRFGIKGRVKPF